MGQAPRFVVEALADAIAYQKTVKPTAPPHDETRVYQLVHKVIGREVHALADKVSANAPLVIVAHSLGCHMMSNLIYDADKHLDKNDCVIDKNSLFETFKTLTSIFTFGCIPAGEQHIRANRVSSRLSASSPARIHAPSPNEPTSTIPTTFSGFRSSR